MVIQGGGGGGGGAGSLKLKYILGMPDIPDFFFCVNTRCLVQAYVSTYQGKNESTPPGILNK